MSAPWAFYGRREELGSLLETVRRPRWFFGAIRGRRRIGKTALIQQALKTVSEDEPAGPRVLLVRIPDSSPADFAAVFHSALSETRLAADAGTEEIHDLPAIAAAVGSLCSRGTIVVLDEFQVCHRGPLSGFPSLLQEQVDRLQDRNAAGGLIVLGSVQAEMEALLHDRRAPLFGRTTFELTLGPWDLATIFEVCRDHGADDPARCLTLWTLFGGVPKYWRHFAETDGLDTVPEWEPWAQQVCERLFLRSGAPFREEGEGLLARELRRNYLAILRTLAERPSSTHAELQDALPELSLGPYLNAVTNDLRLVERKLPIFAGERQRRARYTISDQFLCAWLRVMQPACQAARILPAPRVAQRALAALSTLEGHAFERMVGEATEAASRAGAPDFPITDRVAGYWNRPQTQPGSVEIDFIAWNAEQRRVRFASCKRNPDRHNAASLRGFRDHVERFLATAVGKRFTGWQHQFALFAPRFSRQQRARLEADDWVCRDLVDFQRLLSDELTGQPGTLPVSPKLNGTE